MINKINEYDKLGRLVFQKVVDANIEYRFFYGTTYRICKIKSGSSGSIFKTFIYQKEINDKYVDKKKIETGDIYLVETYYDDNENEIYIKRINKTKNTHYYRHFFRNSKGKALIFLEMYNKELNLNFKIKENILKTWTNKKKHVN